MEDGVDEDKVVRGHGQRCLLRKVDHTSPKDRLEREDTTDDE